MNESAMRVHLNSNMKGAALVEFAIILPMLLILVFGFTELGRALYQKNQLTKEVQIGARYVARYPDAVETDCSTGDEWATAETWAKNQVAETLAGLDPDDVTISIEERDLVVDSVTRTFCVIIVSATMDFDALAGDTIIPMLNIGRITLSARTEERYLAL
ncbi:MAG: TadE/TadG family type IV pilus assembly protein [Pseudomonadota bacterium]